MCRLTGRSKRSCRAITRVCPRDFNCYVHAGGEWTGMPISTSSRQRSPEDSNIVFLSLSSSLKMNSLCSRWKSHTCLVCFCLPVEEGGQLEEKKRSPKITWWRWWTGNGSRVIRVRRWQMSCSCSNKATSVEHWSSLLMTNRFLEQHLNRSTPPPPTVPHPDDGMVSWGARAPAIPFF